MNLDGSSPEPALASHPFRHLTMSTANGSGSGIMGVIVVPSLANTFGAILLGTCVGFMCVFSIPELLPINLKSLPTLSQAVWFDSAPDVPVLPYVRIGHSALEGTGAQSVTSCPIRR